MFKIFRKKYFPNLTNRKTFKKGPIKKLENIGKINNICYINAEKLRNLYFFLLLKRKRRVSKRKRVNITKTVFFKTVKVSRYLIRVNAQFLVRKKKFYSSKKRNRIILFLKNFNKRFSKKSLNRLMFPISKFYKLKWRKLLTVTSNRVFFKKQSTPYLRHIEMNTAIWAFTVLPIPYFFFYSFLLDQKKFWKNMLIELTTQQR